MGEHQVTALSGKKIRARLEESDPDKRLVVSPLLEPAEQLKDDQASIDIRLGFEFATISASAHGLIDALEDPVRSEAIISRLYDKHYVPLGDSFIIHPHQFILGCTLEYIRLPYDLMSYVVGRSTWGRLGLIVATAVGIHPRFAGALTLELRNLGETPLKLYAGSPIGQLFFHEVAGAELGAAAGAGVGKYSGAVDLVPHSVISGNTRSKLEALRRSK